MPRPKLSVTIITLNEEKNLGRALESVRWVDEIVVVDSGSQDRTLEVARTAGARVFQNPWPGFGKQKNFAQDHASHDWILNLDADERVTPELAREIQDLLEKDHSGGLKTRGLRIPRKTYYLGRWILHGGWYPNHLVRLADRRVARWTEPHVHEAWEVKGEIGTLAAPLEHHTFSGIRDQIMTNLRYAQEGSLDLKRRGKSPCLAKLLLKPLGKFIETYFLKRGFLDGLPGLIISINAAHSMFLKYAFLSEDRIQNANPGHR